MANYILILADTNDGDYVTSFKPVSDGDLEKLKPLIEKIKACTEPYNFPTGDQENDETVLEELYISPDNEEQDREAFDLFCTRYIPTSEYGFHTIEKIEIYDVGHIEQLL